MQRPRLGNCLTCLSHFIPYAQDCGADVFFPDFDRFLPIFQEFSGHVTMCYRGSEGRFVKSAPLNPAVLDRIYQEIKSIPDTARCLEEPEFRNLELDDERTYLSEIGFLNGPIRKKAFLQTPLITGFLQKHLITAFWVGFVFRSTHTQKLDELFKIDPAFIDKTAHKYHAFSDRRLPVIGIHIRRGDYVSWQSGVHFHSLEFYAEAIQRISEIFQGACLFFLASSEPVPVRLFEGGNISIGGHSVNEDFVGLSQCDYIVGPPSTFSDHAARIGGRSRVILSNPMNFESLFPAKQPAQRVL